MEYIVISLTALFVAVLSLFSGFGLGTILMPAFALFFPLPVAIAATALVHLANNVFKLVLVGRGAEWRVVAVFALPAALTALPGAWLLGRLSSIPPVATYQTGALTRELSPVKLVIGILIMAFAWFDLLPKLKKMSFSRRYLPLGGVLSGFFGGLSGNQGAFRSAFLVKTGMDTAKFVGTNAICTFAVDLVRLAVYGAAFYTAGLASTGNSIPWLLVLAAMLFAFAGSFVGSRLVKTVTIHAVQYIVGAMLLVVGAGLATGLL